MSPHWHDHNPWKDHVVYVPIEKLAEACGDGRPIKTTPSGDVARMTSDWLLRHWRRNGDKLDAYILPSPHNGMPGYHHSCGVRFGKDGPQYLSPWGDPVKVATLLAEYGEKP